MKGKQLRLRRLFGKEKSVIVPMDHPVYFGPLPGVADPKALVSDVATTDADGVLLTLATLGRVADRLGDLAVVARIDGTHTRLGSRLVEIDAIASVEYAVASGADAVVLNIYVGAENERDLLRKLGQTAEQCERWGMPLIGEMIPIGGLAGHYNPLAGKLSEEEMTDQITLAARVGAELGADIIKTSYTGSKEGFRRVIEGASVPVIVAGGPCGDSAAGLLRMAQEALEAGAQGICFGRNVWQRPNRAEVLKAIGLVTHAGVSADEAAMRLGL